MPIDEKNQREIDLIEDFETNYGQPDTWSECVEEEFEQRWDAIQQAYTDETTMYVCKNNTVPQPSHCTPMAGIAPRVVEFRPPWLDTDTDLATMGISDAAAKKVMRIANTFREKNKQVSQRDAYLLVMLGYAAGYRTASAELL